MFANKVVLITGGSSGIGAAAVEGFAKEGAFVAFVGRNETKLKAVAERCGANTFPIKADIAKDEEAKTIVAKTIERFGKLDVLVNNAGVMQRVSLSDPNILDAFDFILNTNLRSAVLLTSLAIPYLKETKGNIVNVSSIGSFRIPADVEGLVSYSISKAGLDQFTRGAAKEFASFGVRVNSVNPGPVRTRPAINSEGKYFPDDDLIIKMTALGRASEPDEISGHIQYLASDKARSVTGTCFVMDNGVLLK
ncbi:17-beta-hydroxysteroid dehydrogenase 14-like [Trichoplusia ni]|uniref:17-beta-hydroxysteroid dehydrogenase 14-like n=1 Tax=Trichoplusia ni TaxID=7111 RepID=A0A7E5WJK1_TRINI|nr:17-beta-hydroxysteroid dehydrogenase 14-like [Trichoplusia ni]